MGPLICSLKTDEMGRYKKEIFLCQRVQQCFSVEDLKGVNLMFFRRFHTSPRLQRGRLLAHL